MHRIPFIKLSILLISMIGVAIVAGGKHNQNEKLKAPLLEKEKNSDHFKFEVIEDDTTEEEDMEKAMALSKSAFWGLMMATWNCDQKELKKPKEIGFQSEDELLNFCDQWKMIAIAANSFVKNWEKSRKGQKQGDKVGTSSQGSLQNKKEKKTLQINAIENSTKCHFVKPILQIENRELQMSSTMEVIKAEKELGEIFMQYKVLYDKLQKDNAELKEKSAKMQKNNAELEEKSAKMQKNNAELEEKSAKMQKDNAELEEKSAEFQKKDAKIKEKSAQMAEKEEMMNELEKLMSKDPCEQAKLKLKKN
ncbi:hypothetical protein niasHS_011631 [Heterodera schachtii]|uniref:Secretory protein n=1 Tax=Heterodera schachtii TaxID=97005 RepID=A0ABD2INP6_HETSC